MIDPQMFLAELCGGLLPGECQELRTFHRGGERDGKPGPRWFGTDAEDAQKAVKRWPAGLDGYYGPNPRRRAANPREQTGKKADVKRLRYAIADVDDKLFPDGAAGAAAAIAAFPLVPTWVIRSGGGYQVLWSIEPIVLAGPDDPQIAAFEGVQSRIYRALGNADPVQDIGRVLRLPGTRNYKYPDAPEVAIRHHDPEARYRFEEFASLFPVPEPAPRRPRPLLPIGDTSADELREMLSYVNPQPGYADWVRVLAGIHSAFPGPEGIAIAEEWSPGDERNSVEAKFKSFGNYRGVRGPATLGTIVYLARQGGWRPTPRVTFTPPPAGADRSSAAPLDPALVEYLAMPHEALARRAYRAERFNKAYLRFDKNKQVRTQKPTLRAVLFEYDSKARAGKLDADGWAPTSLPALGDIGGASKDAAGDHLRDIAGWGVGIQKDVRDEEYRVPVANGGEIVQKRPRLYIKVEGDVVDKLEELAVFEPPKREGKDTWGGKREPCPHCRSLRRLKVVSCADCGHEFGRKVEEPAVDTPLPDRDAPITPVDLRAERVPDEPAAAAPSVPPTPIAVPPAPATYPPGRPVYVREEETEEGDDWDPNFCGDDWDPNFCNAPRCTKRIDPGLGRRYCWEHRHLGLAPAAPPRTPIPPAEPWELPTEYDGDDVAAGVL